MFIMKEQQLLGKTDLKYRGVPQKALSFLFSEL